MAIAQHQIQGKQIGDGQIQAADIAAGAVDSSELADGGVDPSHVAGLADTAATVRVRSVLQLTREFSFDDFDASDDLTIAFPSGHAVLITDVKCHLTTVEGGALTGTLHTAANAGGTAISSALDLDATNTDILRTTKITAGAIAAAGSVYFNGSANPAACVGRLVIEYVHTT